MYSLFYPGHINTLLFAGENLGGKRPLLLRERMKRKSVRKKEIIFDFGSAGGDRSCIDDHEGDTGQTCFLRVGSRKNRSRFPEVLKVLLSLGDDLRRPLISSSKATDRHFSACRIQGRWGSQANIGNSSGNFLWSLFGWLIKPPFKGVTKLCRGTSFRSPPIRCPVAHLANVTLATG